MVKQKCRSETDAERSPSLGVKVTNFAIVTTLFIPIILVGTDMVTDVEVIWSMATPFFFTLDPCLEEKYKETFFQAVVRVLCILGSLIIFVVALVTMFKKPGPIPFLMRSVRTSASMGSRNLEENDHAVPLGKIDNIDLIRQKKVDKFILNPSDHLTRFDKMIEESNGESMVQIGIQGIFYLYMVNEATRANNGPGAETAVTFSDIRFSILVSLLALANGKFKVVEPIISLPRKCQQHL